KLIATRCRLQARPRIVHRSDLTSIQLQLCIILKLLSGSQIGLSASPLRRGESKAEISFSDGLDQIAPGDRGPRMSGREKSLISLYRRTQFSRRVYFAARGDQTLNFVYGIGTKKRWWPRPHIPQ